MVKSLSQLVMPSKNIRLFRKRALYIRLSCISYTQKRKGIVNEGRCNP